MDKGRRVLNRAVFLDRDGVLIRKAPENQYITAWEQVEFLPGVGEALRKLKQNGYLLIIVTNQSAVSRNELPVDVLESIHKRMVHHLARERATIDAIYYCPHDRNGNCPCRKPRPQMLLQAAAEHGIDLQQSWMVGDAASDIEAGRTAGCRTIWIRLPSFNGESPPPADFSTTSIQEAAGWILKAGSPLNEGAAAEIL
ncbi:MAG: HAD family hydrolase [Terriglobia bacterium]|jgi:histidinol-phosphate phosphatase family protein